MGGLGIEADVELGHRGDVAVGGDRPAHHHQPGHAPGQGRIQAQGQGQVGERPERDQQQAAGVFMGQAQDRLVARWVGSAARYAAA